MMSRMRSPGRLYLRNATRGFMLDTPRVRRVVHRLLAEIGQATASLSLSFVRDTEIRDLNRIHRAKDRPTDVLSFPLEADPGEDTTVERLLGDIVISLDTAAVQAKAYEASLEAEVERLLIHGLLHLLGHDHEEPEERARMEAEERRLATSIGLPWPYLEERA